jgi:hypothetical protein
MDIWRAVTYKMLEPIALHQVLEFHDSRIRFRDVAKIYCEFQDSDPQGDVCISTAHSLGFTAFPSAETCDLERLAAWSQIPLLAKALDEKNMAYIVIGTVFNHASLQRGGVYLYNPLIGGLQNQMTMHKGPVFDWDCNRYGVYIIAGRAK